MTFSLRHAGIRSTSTVHRNLNPTLLVEHALRRGEGSLAAGGALVTRTGKYTGRSPNDKFTVLDETTEDAIWWGDVNRSISKERFDALHVQIAAYLQGRELYVQDCYAGSDSDHRLKVRVITERAWHSNFAHNMFIQAAPQELANWTPEFTVLQAPGFKTDPEHDGVNSEASIMIDFTQKLVLICGTEYAGEIKKSIFTALNFMLPEKGVLGMHCSANTNEEGQSAVFFGLSGTGKTTLSADPSRSLIGDDEHGWSDNGVFNFEGGCYAKVIRLDPEAEPVIFGTTQRFGTLLENVVMNAETRELDLFDGRYTENTRASYDITQVPNRVESLKGNHPTDIVMLTCDAFGVLPPLSRMTPEQAMYHFLSGYTAKVAGTERGVTEPTAAFSACFGAPFMARHPSVYAQLLGDKIARHKVRCWLVNTGWTGGAYGVGERMKIQWTRRLLEAAITGELDATDFTPHPFFKVSLPAHVHGVPTRVLQPRETWEDKQAYDAQAAHLVGLFQENFAPYVEHVTAEVLAAAPSLS